MRISCTLHIPVCKRLRDVVSAEETWIAFFDVNDLWANAQYNELRSWRQIYIRWMRGEASRWLGWREAWGYHTRHEKRALITGPPLGGKSNVQFRLIAGRSDARPYLTTTCAPDAESGACAARVR